MKKKGERKVKSSKNKSLSEIGEGGGMLKQLIESKLKIISLKIK